MGNGTGCVTLLQSTLPNLTYGSFNYVTKYSGFEYAKIFDNAIISASQIYDYDPTDLIIDLDSEKRLQYDAHNVYEHPKSQSGVEWHWDRKNSISSTVSNKVLP